MTKGEQTRLRIIETALECFFEVGITETTFKMISEKSGLTQAGIYVYFRDKNSLLLACSEYAIERGRKFVGSETDKESDARDTLRTYLYRNLQWVFKDRKTVHSLIAMYYFGATDPILRKLHWAIDQNAIGRIEGFLLSGNRENKWTIVNPKNLARQIHNVLVGEMIKSFHWPNEKKLDDRFEDLWSFIEPSF